MKDNFNKNLMANEIKKRLNSKSWDNEIATAVFEKKKKSNRRKIYSIGSASLIAASLLMAFLFAIRNSPVKSNYNQFISNQIEGFS